MTTPAIGQPAPDVTLLTSRGDEIQLSELWKKQPAVVVFLRYFG
jgi:peroxiredoxin